MTISLVARNDRPSELVVEVDQLGVRYGNFEAVRNLSFHVERGELYALLGTNGAGKTSALEVIEGHRKPSSGLVRVFGRSPAERRQVRPRMGIMLQESGFANDLTVAQTVHLLGRLSGRTDSAERLVSAVDLTRKADTKVSQLSGGEKRRLDFATAVYGQPELIFLDEPTTGLDIQTRDALWETVQTLRARGATIVLTTHYLEEAQQYADRIGLMHRGTLRQQGTVAELTQDLPATIRFALPQGAPPPPVGSDPTSANSYLVHTTELQRDLTDLLAWAGAHHIELLELSATPTRLDDVFRSLGSQPAAA